MRDDQIQLVPISKNGEYCAALYELLKKRHSAISHENLPAFTEHEEFVKNNPYRYWFIVKSDAKNIGTVYIHHDNTIGINLLIEHVDKIKIVLTNILTHYKPLAPVKSVRSKWFCINIPSVDETLATEIVKLQGVEIQRTYAFKRI